MFRKFRKKKEKRIYLDYAAATPVHSDVFSVMLPYFTEVFGNPGSIHTEGARAMGAIEEARDKLARTLRVRASDVTFTSGGTEANNLGLFGYVETLLQSGRDPADIEVISTKIEHPSILRVLERLGERGVVVHYAAVTSEGRIDQNAFQTLLTDKTALVTFTYANSEIGVVEEVKRLARIVKKHNTEKGTDTKIHLDAAQAPLWLPCEMDSLGVDMLTLDAGKCYGPKGVGVLVHRGVTLTPQLLGGGQEAGLRSGTENTPLVVGCVEAILRAQRDWKSRSEATASLRDFMIDQLEKEIPGVALNGSREHRLANNVNISIPGIDSEFAVVKLDVRGIAASTKSACGGAKAGGSKVVACVSGDAARAASTIRFSLGEDTTKEELVRAVQVLAAHVEMVRNSLN